MPKSAGREGRPFRLGDSLVVLEEYPAATIDPVRQARGWRYITLQVSDVEGVHEKLRGEGVREGLATITLGEVVPISMILDPMGTGSNFPAGGRSWAAFPKPPDGPVFRRADTGEGPIVRTYGLDFWF